MITEKEYIEAQKIVDTYKAEQLDLLCVSGMLPTDPNYCNICKGLCENEGAMYDEDFE